MIIKIIVQEEVLGNLSADVAANIDPKRIYILVVSAEAPVETLYDQIAKKLNFPSMAPFEVGNHHPPHLPLA